MMNRPLRAKLAALAVLFFLGTFAGQIQHLLDSVRGKVEAGQRVTDDIRATVTTIGQAVDESLEGVGQTTANLTNQVADLQGKLAVGTATPAQIAELQALLGRLRVTTGRPGPAGPAGPTGASGPPGPPGATSSPSPSTTTSTTAGGATSTTRPPTATTTTARPSTTTTTTRCVAGVGRLIRIGC